MLLETDKIGERLKQVRGAYTQAEFSNRLGFSKTTIFNYEKSLRVPDGYFLIRLYERFGTDPLWLLTGIQGQSSVDDLPEDHLLLLASFRQCSDEMQDAIRVLLKAHLGSRSPWIEVRD